MLKIRQNNEVDMINGPLMGKLFLFAVPVMLSNMLQLLFNAADVAVIGQFCGTTSVAAVSSNGAVINLIINIAVGMGTAINVIMARHWGAGNMEGARRTVHTAVMFSGVVGLIVGVVGFFAAPAILNHMNVTPEVLPLAALYLKVYFAGIPSTIVYNFAASLLRAVGDTRHPFYYLAIAGVFNVVFNVIFVAVFDMDVAGVALASALSQVLSSYLTLRCLTRRSDDCHLDIRNLYLDKITVISILRIGIPAALQGSAFSISNIYIQRSINIFGTIAMAGCGAAANVDNIVYFMGAAYIQASTTFMSQNYGAGKTDRLWKVVGACVLQTFLVGLIVGNLAYAFSRPLLSVFTRDTEAIAIGQTYMKYLCTLIFIDNIMDTGGALLRGMNKSWLPMIVTLLGVCVFRIVWVYTYFASHHTLEGLLLSYPVSWIITATVHYINLFICINKYKKARGVV